MTLELLYNCFLLLCSLFFFYLFFSDTIKEKEDSLSQKFTTKQPDSIKETGDTLQKSISELSNSIKETGDTLQKSVINLSNSLKETKKNMQQLCLIAIKNQKKPIGSNSGHIKKQSKDPKAA